MPKKYREVRAALAAAGWIKVRQAGSHEAWRAPDGRRQVVVSGKDSDTIAAGTLASIRRQTGMEDLR